MRPAGLKCDMELGLHQVSVSFIWVWVSLGGRVDLFMALGIDLS